METVAKKYEAKFVVDISDLGKDDQLMQNIWRGLLPKADKDTLRENLRPHWCGTVDTGSLQGKILVSGSLSEFGYNQLHWLTRTLEETSSNWRIVVGFHPLATCEDSEAGMEAKQVLESLQHTFMKYEVNAYISGQGCCGNVQKGKLS